ncbi:RNA-binding protein [Anaerosalibacter massiliensis]|uniref:YlmH/Sll1252 family protein n=1 Tax=Anaerosalibacter massiliensis TaxID=1347392 RepID=A0A9X2S3M0_9FIRM|nr:YlmH/Sll1252 family protein [Anaerosalibacter massiliensis]MCR2042553.1 YlmH/Sll1252 family protein [Anaerosalibacter massiliensis]
MIKDKDRFISHINDEHQIFNMRRVLDKVEIVLARHSIENTDFLDPYERRLSKSILSRFDDISYSEDGGLLNAERKIISIFPDYLAFEKIRAPIVPLSINGSVEGLKHKDFLGSLMGLGITREKVGDILLHEEEVQIIVEDSISDYIMFNLKKVGNKSVNVNLISREELKEGKKDFKKKGVIIPSLRLDAVISKTFNLSRKDSLNLINSGKIKVNWEPINKPFLEINEGDLISVKGYGRFILSNVLGKTRKERIKANITIFK